MRTIQEILRECDREKLLDAYDAEFPVTSYMLEKELMSRSVEDLINRRRNKLNKMIDRMISLVPAERKSEYIMFAHHIMDIGANGYDNEDVTFVLAKKEDILDKTKDFYIGYGYEFDTHEEMMSIKVAETYTTKYYMSELLADFLHEASFFGCEQERLEEEKQKLEDSIKESKEHPELLKELDEEFWNDLYESLGVEREIRDKEEEERYWEARREIMKIAGDYNAFCNRNEAGKVRKLLEA